MNGTCSYCAWDLFCCSLPLRLDEVLLALVWVTGESVLNTDLNLKDNLEKARSVSDF